MAKFECYVREGLATVPSVDPIAQRLVALFGKVSAALPDPGGASDAATALRRCLAERAGQLGGALTAAEMRARVPALLGADFCARLFGATANVELYFVPHDGVVPPVRGEPFTPAGVQVTKRTVHADDSVAYVQPYAAVVARGSSESEPGFPSDDHFVRLSAQPNANVRKKAAEPAINDCTIETLTALEMPNSYQEEQCASWSYPSCRKGCYSPDRSEVMPCRPAQVGWKAAGGTAQATECPTLDPAGGARYYLTGQNDECPLICGQSDWTDNGGRCAPTHQGSYSPVCNNLVLPCAAPIGVPVKLFKAMVQFTSTGSGKANGCEATLTFPFVKQSSDQAAALQPPFTIELWVKMSESDIPAAQIDPAVPSLAVLAGVFPRWYVALSRTGQHDVVRIGLYHAGLTMSNYGREHSIAYSDPLMWSGNTWHHVAVVVEASSDSLATIAFYVDGTRISGRSAALRVSDPPIVHFTLANISHFGPPNTDLAQHVLADGRKEPYFEKMHYFEASLDEFRVSLTSLDALSQGWSLTELRRRAPCDEGAAERLDGSVCKAAARFTAAHAAVGQASCQEGFEPCAARPGLCVAQCRYGTVRRPDCTCDCPANKFQAWLIKGVRIEGATDSIVRNVSVYDSQHRLVEHVSHAPLPLEIRWSDAPRHIAAVSVLGGTATVMDLYVISADGERRLSVPDHMQVALREDRATILHHRLTHEFFDPTLACAVCPGTVFGSTLPRLDTLACQCAKGFGRNLLGRCLRLKAGLPSPTVSPQQGFHTAGTRIRLMSPALDASFGMEGEWRMKVHYKVVPGNVTVSLHCASSEAYEETNDGSIPGLDLLKPHESVSVCAITCHPLYHDSPSQCWTFTGNGQLHPPKCDAVGTLSTSSTYALGVTVNLAVEGHADATIQYKLGDQNAMYYNKDKPVVIDEVGTTVMKAWAEKYRYDKSAEATCVYTVDGPARVRGDLQWPDTDEGAQLGGFVAEHNARSVQRGVETLRFALTAQSLTGHTLRDPIQIQYRFVSGSSANAEADANVPWLQLPSDGAASQLVADLVGPAAEVSPLLAVLQWRIKESGSVWSEPESFRLLFVTTRTSSPLIQATPSHTLGLTDSWMPGPQRVAALKQAHRVAIRISSPQSRRLFAVVGAQVSPEDFSNPLFKLSDERMSSVVDHNAIVPNVEIVRPSLNWGPDELTEGCSATVPAGEDASSTQHTAVMRLCEYLMDFEVLANTSILAVSIRNGEWESVPTIHEVPRDEEPPRGDVQFQALVLAKGNYATVTGDESKNLFVLPSASQELTYTLSQDGFERHSCVLISRYAHAVETAHSWQHPQLEDCLWQRYDGEQSVGFEALVDFAGQPLRSDMSINITVLSTLRKEKFLPSYPRATTFLLLRERAPQPSVVSVRLPSLGLVDVAAAMVWLESAKSHVVDGSVLECYFTLDFSPERALGDNPLISVPDALQNSLHERTALLPSDRVRKANRSSDDWFGDERLCEWPHLCKLPLNGTWPARLVKAPSGLEWLCAWTILNGYVESSPNCQKIELKNAHAEPALVGFQKVGRDVNLGADILDFHSAEDTSSEALATRPNERRLSTYSPSLQLTLAPRTHHLRFRYKALRLTPAELRDTANVNALVDAATFQGGWHQVGVDDAQPQVQLPPAGLRWPSAHTLLVLDVEMRTGIDHWSPQPRKRYLVLQGRHRDIDVMRSSNRTFWLHVVSVTPSQAIENSTILYRWNLDSPRAPMVPNGRPIWGLRPTEDFHSVDDAYVLDAGVQARLLPLGTHPSSCIAPRPGVDSEAELIREAEQGPLLCQAVGSTRRPVHIALQAPDERRWGLWAAALGSGLALSTPSLLVMEAQCLVAAVPLGGHPPCREGFRIDSGTSCTPRCRSGYEPTVQSLACNGGVLDPPTFKCIEASCVVPSNMSNVASTPCLEGTSVSSGSVCTTQCRAGFAPSVTQLSCNMGVLNPPSFECADAPCAAPGSVLRASNPSCSGMESVASGAECIPRCEPGFAPSEKSLACMRGVLTPLSFTCEEVPCSLDVVENAADMPCVEGAQIAHGANCTPRCRSDWYKPSTTMLSCVDGAFKPSTFVCSDKSILSTNAPALLAGTAGGVMAIAFAVIMYCMNRLKPHGASSFEDEEESSPIDDLSEWLNECSSVEPGICVLCRTNALDDTQVHGLVKEHGPPTAFTCCASCAQVVGLIESFELDEEAGQGRAASEAEHAGKHAQSGGAHVPVQQSAYAPRRDQQNGNSRAYPDAAAQWHDYGDHHEVDVRSSRAPSGDFERPLASSVRSSKAAESDDHLSARHQYHDALQTTIPRNSYPDDGLMRADSDDTLKAREGSRQERSGGSMGSGHVRSNSTSSSHGRNSSTSRRGEGSGVRPPSGSASGYDRDDRSPPQSVRGAGVHDYVESEGEGSPATDAELSGSGSSRGRNRYSDGGSDTATPTSRRTRPRSASQRSRTQEAELGMGSGVFPATPTRPRLTRRSSAVELE
eukprot:TRINITY_DN26163_c0_g1_i1.p1 TRINITY_DN26163_c0_g1~~TRINITY_DN26163_c0_g1_i1.p1  ORF type:complete len:2479 (-),score=333.80 TRINITY_DN26163_c0_g1_i1:35-7471(-)